MSPLDEGITVLFNHHIKKGTAIESSLNQIGGNGYGSEIAFVNRGGPDGPAGSVLVIGEDVIHPPCPVDDPERGICRIPAFPVFVPERVVPGFNRRTGILVMSPYVGTHHFAPGCIGYCLDPQGYHGIIFILVVDRQIP